MRASKRLPRRVVLSKAKVPQTADLILAWLVAEDDGARKHITNALTKQSESLETVKASLQGIEFMSACLSSADVCHRATRIDRERRGRSYGDEGDAVYSHSMSMISS